MRPHEDPVSLPKIFLISSLALATLVPTFFVSGLIAEREARQGVVQSEFTRNWGPPQELRSPTLVVPYQSAPDRPCGYLKITPDRLSVTANLTPQERKRGLFHATGKASKGLSVLIARSVSRDPTAHRSAPAASPMQQPLARCQ